MPLVRHELADVLPFVASRGHAAEADAGARTCAYSWRDESVYIPCVTNLVHGPRQRTLTMFAARVGNVARLGWLADRGADLSQRGAFGRTAMVEAVMAG